MHVPPPGFVARESRWNQAYLTRRHGSPTVILACLAVGVVAGCLQAAEPANADSASKLPPPVRLELQTSDRLKLATWYYPIREQDTPLATVLLLHDLGGSHESVEPLSLKLQASDCAVLTPDLRGHGESIDPKLERASGSRPPSELLKSQDFQAMIAMGGGLVRDQASVHGDIESVRRWIKEQPATKGGVNLSQLYIVGSGLGAALAANWTAADTAWPPITGGPQGGDVNGLVFIDPMSVAKGFSILPALSQEPVKTKLPLMVIAGPDRRDADKIFAQVKRWRPDDWFDSRLGRRSPAKDSEATLVYVELKGQDRRGARITGDGFAALRSENPQQPDPAYLILNFIKATSARRP